MHNNIYDILGTYMFVFICIVLLIKILMWSKIQVTFNVLRQSVIFSK